MIITTCPHGVCSARCSQHSAEVMECGAGVAQCLPFCSHRRCILRRSTPTRPTSCSTSSRGWNTPSSCQRSTVRRWPTPVAWTKTLSRTIRSTVSSSDPCCSSISQHYSPPPPPSGRRQAVRAPSCCRWLRAVCRRVKALFLLLIADLAESTKVVHFVEPSETTPHPLPLPSAYPTITSRNID